MNIFSQTTIRSACALACVLFTGVASAEVQPASQAAAPGARADALTPSQRMYGEIAPKLADLTDKVLYGDVWERPGLSKRDRSLVTVSALIAMNRPDQLRSHLRIARDNGVTEAEMVETITHLAFYAGWPNAVTAIKVAQEVFTKPQPK
jgi:4-carboxymuconolactone decarboxylase